MKYRHTKCYNLVHVTRRRGIVACDELTSSFSSLAHCLVVFHVVVVGWVEVPPSASHSPCVFVVLRSMDAKPSFRIDLALFLGCRRSLHSLLFISNVTRLTNLRKHRCLSPKIVHLPLAKTLIHNGSKCDSLSAGNSSGSNM